MEKNWAHKKRVALILILACLLAAFAAFGIEAMMLKRTLASASNITTKDFTTIMDSYTHSFRMYEQILQLEMSSGASEDEIAAYLKEQDAKFQEIDGADYDGVYLYYHGRYLYSWGTPYSVYEKRGYQVTERPWYIGAVRSAGDIWFSVPYHSYANPYMLATISRLQPDGETVIAYDIKLGAIQQYAAALSLHKGSLTLLCDMDGNVIGTTQPQYAGMNAMQSSEKWCRTFQKAVQAPDHLQFSIKDEVFTYSHANGSYSCTTIVPVWQVMSSVLLYFAILATIFVLEILLRDNQMIRMQHAKELRMKNQQLADAVVRADAACAAKSQFLAQMSHEIRTPMNAVIGLTNIARSQTQSPEKTADYLDKIDRSSRLLLSLINDILDMSAIEGGKMKIDSAVFDFSGMLTNLTTLFYEQTRQKGITFEVHLRGVTEELVIGDELRVNQVLMNLLSNAVKFTPEGGKVTLTVLQASRSQGKVQMRFMVEDTGCGMSEEMLGRLFQPFEQESASTARKHGGSGLGLSIAKRLVEMMGGSVQVQSTQGKGSVFTADIPFAVEKNAKIMTVSDFSRIRALVVDDETDSCEYTCSLLQRMNVRNDAVTDGQTALEKLGDAEEQGDPYTLCLIDWKMPGMNGQQLIRQIREIFGKDAILILVSAYDRSELENNEDVGPDDFIPKPLFQSTLYNALMRLAGHQKWQQVPETAKERFDFTGKKVLVAEDVELNMEVIQELLQMVGITVVGAENGEKAVALFRASAPWEYDCILMDVNMPVMDGYEATQAIRQEVRADAAGMPIYAMTANAFAEDVTAALNAGMNGHIAKPIETVVLYKTLEMVFAHKADAESESV